VIRVARMQDLELGRDPSWKVDRQEVHKQEGI